MKVAAAALGILVAACGSSRLPTSLRGYEILVARGSDPQTEAFAEALRQSGLRVRREVRGGGRPTAALVFFLFSEPGRAQPSWLHLRLADTRSGAIVGIAAIPLDSVGPSPRERAVAAVRALTSP